MSESKTAPEWSISRERWLFVHDIYHLPIVINLAHVTMVRSESPDTFTIHVAGGHSVTVDENPALMEAIRLTDLADSGFSYGWSVSALRYRDLTTGQFVAKADVLDVMQGRIDEAFVELKDLASAVFNGAADVTDFENAARVVIKNLDLQMTGLASGGFDNVTQQAYGELGVRLREEYKYLNGFASDIADGNLSEAQILARLDSYAADSWGAFADAERVAMADGGMTEEMRVLEDGADHCEDCEGLAGDRAPIGTLPDIGDSQCGSRCQCTFDYR